MRISVIFSDGVKQIMLTPENKDEKFALDLISPDDNIDMVVKAGSMYGGEKYGVEPFRANMSMCQGGYLRVYEDTESKILILTPKKKE